MSKDRTSITLYGKSGLFNIFLYIGHKFFNHFLPDLVLSQLKKSALIIKNIIPQSAVRYLGLFFIAKYYGALYVYKL